MARIGASPAIRLALIDLQRSHGVYKAAELLGTSPFTLIRMADGLPVFDTVILRIETKLAELTGAPAPTPKPSLVGQRLGKLVVLSEAPPSGKGGGRAVNVRCDCGTEKAVRVDSLMRPKQGARSCGCKHDAASSSPHVKVERGKVLYEAFGRWQTLPQWAAETGIPLKTLDSRIRSYGRSPEQAMTMMRVKRGDFSGTRRAS